eukprot:scaffold106488_cov14-Tisochrysis_lutea.AAC.1
MQVDAALADAAATRGEELQRLEETRATNNSNLEQRLEGRVAAAEISIGELSQSLEDQGHALGQSTEELKRLCCRGSSLSQSTKELELLAVHTGVL